MGLTSKMAGRFTGATERTKKFLDLPGYDEGTRAAQKEMDDEIARLKKLEKSKELTTREEKKLNMLMNRKAREESAETEAGMATERKTKKLSPREQKEMQESLEMNKGGYAKKTMKMNKGGYANCGASIKPNGGSRNK
jgi:hypothetical protein